MILQKSASPRPKNSTDMAITHDFPSRISSIGQMGSQCLEEKFEIIKEVGDGSFGSVALARVRTAGAHVAKRGTMVNIDHASALLNHNNANLILRLRSRR